MPRTGLARARALRALLAFALLLAPLPLAFLPEAAGLTVPICAAGAEVPRTPAGDDGPVAPAQHCPACVLVAPVLPPTPAGPLPRASRLAWPPPAATTPATPDTPHPQARAPPAA